MTDKIIDRIQKLLRLSKSSNEHEAALAASNAAALMAEHQISDAQLRVDDPTAPNEAIGDTVVERRGTRIAWRGRIAHGVAASMGCKMYWRDGGNVSIIGKPSHVAAVTYTYQYLCCEIDRIADEAWEQHQYEARETVRVWKNAFRLGAASVIHSRLHADIGREAAKPAGRESQAMVLVRQDVQAVMAYAANLHLRAGRPAKVSSRDGYDHGQEAGRSVVLGGGGAGALGSGAKRIAR